MSRNKQAKKANSRRGGYEVESYENVVSKQNRRKVQEEELANQMAQLEYENEKKQAKVIPPLRALNEAQGMAIAAIKDNILSFLIGPAGTGKSYISAALAVEALQAGEVDKIVFTRPKTTAGDEDWGALPGDLDMKFQEYLEPFIDILDARLGCAERKKLIKCGIISAKPIAFLRGKTFHDVFVVLDEGENVCKAQMKCLLTRIGDNVKMVVNGDIEQTDIRNSGLQDAVDRTKNIFNVATVEFLESDIVRSGITRDIVIAYRK
jgi:phosphate starvation-inducible PhoH-like protein